MVDAVLHLLDNFVLLLFLLQRTNQMADTVVALLQSNLQRFILRMKSLILLLQRFGISASLCVLHFLQMGENKGTLPQ